MDLIEQLRTTQGRFPVKSAICELEGGLLEAKIRFRFDDSGKEPSGNLRGSDTSRSREFGIEDLAFLYGSNGHLDHMLIQDLAGKTGPIFGAHRKEFIADWVTESHMVKDVVTIQEVLNGRKPYALINGGCDSAHNAMVAKAIVRNASTSNSFAMYSFTVSMAEGTTAAFFGSMPTFPHFKKFSAQGAFDYAFFDLGEDDFGRYMTITLFAFKREITAFDFAVAISAFIGEEENGEDYLADLMKQASDEIGFSIESLPDNYFGLSGELSVEEISLDKSDAFHLQKLVHAIVSLHLRGIGIDVFRSNESDDFMVFPNYLSYLWYRFSRQLGQVKIGYCEMCGRGFSLAGHRGISRSYCSERCKTKAKNARVKRQRDLCRELFLDKRLTVEEVAKTVYSEELSGQVRANKKKSLDGACSQVRKNLVGYPAFKHKVDDDLKAGKGAPFVRRCMDEGVLSAEQVAVRIRELGIASASKK